LRPVQANDNRLKPQPPGTITNDKADGYLNAIGQFHVGLAKLVHDLLS
jgi:hypothetical protein